MVVAAGGTAQPRGGADSTCHQQEVQARGIQPRRGRGIPTLIQTVAEAWRYWSATASLTISHAYSLVLVCVAVTEDQWWRRVLPLADHRLS